MYTLTQKARQWSDDIALQMDKFYRLIVAVVQARHDSRFLHHCIGKTRRFLLVHFRKDYVQQQLNVREGSCHQCGTCCNLLFTCPMLTKGGKCSAYGICRPEACKVFPIDKRDIVEVELCGHHCGYHFDTEKSN